MRKSAHQPASRYLLYSILYICLRFAPRLTVVGERAGATRRLPGAVVLRLPYGCLAARSNGLQPPQSKAPRGSDGRRACDAVQPNLLAGQGCACDRAIGQWGAKDRIECDVGGKRRDKCPMKCGWVSKRASAFKDPNVKGKVGLDYMTL